MSLWRCRGCSRVYEIVVGDHPPPRACMGCGFAFYDAVEKTPARRMDALAGEKNKEEAIERVDRHMDPEWRQKTMQAIWILAKEKPEFTTDDVWKFVPSTRENKAMGACMMRAKKQGLVQPTERHIPSERPDCNRRPVKVWKSLLFRGAA